MENRNSQKRRGQTAKEPMTRIAIKFTIKELELLTSLAADQVFRREFIDPKMPGYRGNHEEIGLGKALIERMRTSLKSSSSNHTNGVRIAG